MFQFHTQSFVYWYELPWHVYSIVHNTTDTVLCVIQKASHIGWTNTVFFRASAHLCVSQVWWVSCLHSDVFSMQAPIPRLAHERLIGRLVLLVVMGMTSAFNDWAVSRTITIAHILLPQRAPRRCVRSTLTTLPGYSRSSVSGASEVRRTDNFAFLI